LVSITDKPKLASGVRLKYDNIRRKEVLLYPEGLHALSDSASSILKLCNGENTVAKLLRDLLQEYEVGDVSDFESQVMGFLEDFAREKFIVLS
jgi:pyrroloquinoline quinone biosynthesis protein D